ncbi:MAG: tetratricopeptide repeat protein [Bernardetiaceae bacterium]|jgi:outer membrane protein assembly factor BamD (BamD/ComL family)|nr:tetratricopeptide repeat protein [Bernardetiaceae bacterium]
MKKIRLGWFLTLGAGLVLSLGACRTYHDTTAKYNAWFLADEKLREVETALFQAQTQRDNYNEVLQVFSKIDTTTASAQKAGLDYVIEKASLPIKFHASSQWVDDCYLLIGKARLYKGDFRNAANTFKYVNTKSPDPDARQTALVWLLRTFVEQGNDKDANYVADYLAKQDHPINDANARDFYLAMAHYYRLKNDWNRTEAYVEKALPFIKEKELGIRALYIAASLAQRRGDDARAFEYYSQLSRRSPAYEVLFFSQLASARSVDLADEKAVAKTERDLNTMLNDDKNLEFRDRIFYEMGRFASRRGQAKTAIRYFENSLLVGANNAGQKVYTYLETANTYFEKLQKFDLASSYYDSALLLMNETSPDFEAVKRRSETLQAFGEAYTNLQAADRLLKLATLKPEALDKFLEEEIANEKADIDAAMAQERRRNAENAKLLADMNRVRANQGQGGFGGGQMMSGGMGQMGGGMGQMSGGMMPGGQMGGGMNNMGGGMMPGGQMGGGMSNMGGGMMPGGQMGGGMSNMGGGMMPGGQMGSGMNNMGGGMMPGGQMGGGMNNMGGGMMPGGQMGGGMNNMGGGMNNMGGGMMPGGQMGGGMNNMGGGMGQMGGGMNNMGGGMIPGGSQTPGFGNSPNASPGTNMFGGMGGPASNFYFYNPQAVAQGRQEFARIWGNLTLSDNWRRSEAQSLFNSGSTNDSSAVTVLGGGQAGGQIPVSKTPSAAELEQQLLAQRYAAITPKPERAAAVPGTPEKIAETQKQLEESLMKTGRLYHQSFKESQKAVVQLERLVTEFPKSEFVPEALYTLYLACKEPRSNCDPAKYQQQLTSRFPNSPYARLLGTKPQPGQTSEEVEPTAMALVASPTDTLAAKQYSQAYQLYQQNNYQQALTTLDQTARQYPSTIHTDKIVLLKALCQLGLDPASPEASRALNEFAKKFPKSELNDFVRQVIGRMQGGKTAPPGSGK